MALVFDIAQYDYHLPPELIAQRPLQHRDRSRLMVLDRATGGIRHQRFGDVVNYLGPEDLVVVNDSKVLPARLFGKKETGARVECLLLREVEAGPPGRGRAVWECLLRPARRISQGVEIHFGPQLKARVAKVKSGGLCELMLAYEKDLLSLLEEIGHMPLPPYIRRPDEVEDRQRYQTVYARHYGSVAAPTAGLHFSHELLARLQAKGVNIVAVTLHVGLGTFQPVRERDIRKHHMHSELVEVLPQAAQAVNLAKDQGKRVVAVGTTTVRVLEFMAEEQGRVRSGRSSCDLYIYPGYEFKIVDAMITNFHLPKSSLLLLCSAFAGREVLLAAYQEAVRRRYRFYSYGDAMLIL